MTIVDDRNVVARTLSEAWLAAVCLLASSTEGSAVHLIVRILDPGTEVPNIRRAAQKIIDDLAGYPDIETTRNTIFPAAWARRFPEPQDLAEYYQARYNRDGILGFPHNERGTYFGRLVAYPRIDGSTADQLTDVVRKVRDELATPNPKSSRYEMNVYCEARDRSPMSFPCLAHVSLHLHHRRLHMQAVYRNEHLVARAYGNYLGLSQLLVYVSQACDTEPGELMVTVGHVTLDAGKRRVAALLAEFQNDAS